MHWMVLVVLIVAWLHAVAVHTVTKKANKGHDTIKANTGHHYQRDMIFNSLFK